MSRALWPPSSFGSGSAAAAVDADKSDPNSQPGHRRAVSSDAYVPPSSAVVRRAAKAAFELFLPGATAIIGLTEDIITKVKEGANC